MKTFDYYANGQWHKPSSGEYLESIDPTTGEVWAQIPKCNQADVDVAVQAAHQAFEYGSMGQAAAF